MTGIRLVAPPDGIVAPRALLRGVTPQEREDAFLEYLYELEVSSDVLRRDPRGQSWLAPEWRRQVEADRRLQDALATYVHEELELFESVRVRADFVFTNAVVTATEPSEMFGAGLDPRFRTWIVAGAWALAIGVAYLMWAQLVHLLHG